MLLSAWIASHRLQHLVFRFPLTLCLSLAHGAKQSRPNAQRFGDFLRTFWTSLRPITRQQEMRGCEQQSYFTVQTAEKMWAKYFLELHLAGKRKIIFSLKWTEPAPDVPRHVQNKNNQGENSICTKRLSAVKSYTSLAASSCWGRVRMGHCKVIASPRIWLIEGSCVRWDPALYFHQRVGHPHLHFHSPCIENVDPYPAAETGRVRVKQLMHGLRRNICICPIIPDTGHRSRC